jgi:hypothetical protein
MNRVLSTGLQIYVFIVYFFLSLIGISCFCWVLAYLAIIVCLICMYGTGVGFNFYPETFREVANFLECWLPNNVLTYFKSEESESFLTLEVFWEKTNELVYGFHKKYHKELMIIASSLWCTINWHWGPTTSLEQYKPEPPTQQPSTKPNKQEITEDWIDEFTPPLEDLPEEEEQINIKPKSRTPLTDEKMAQEKKLYEEFDRKETEKAKQKQL